MSTFQIAGRTFSSKKACKDEVSRILRTTPRYHTLSGNEFELVRALLDHHPRSAEKIGQGVESIFVGCGRRENCFWIKRTDGSETDFSYVKCLYTPTQWTNIHQAARNAVRDQILLFKNRAFAKAATILCEITHVPIQKDNSDVDHKVPFDLLLENFFRENGLSLDQKIDGYEDGSTELSFADKKLEHQWVVYHQKHADLRMASCEANRKRTKK